MPSASLAYNLSREYSSVCHVLKGRRSVHLAGRQLSKPLVVLALAARLNPYSRNVPYNVFPLSHYLILKRPLTASVSPGIQRSWVQRCLYGTGGPHPEPSQSNQPKSKVTDITQIYAELHQQARKGQYKQTQEVAVKLLREYGERPNSRIYEALILCNTDCWYGSASEVARVLQDMTDEGVEHTSATLHAALRVLAIHPDYLLRSHILDELRQRWLSLNQDGWHDLVVGLLRDRHIEQALDIIEQMQREGVATNPWLYDMVIYTLCAAEEFDEALRLLELCVDTIDLPISPTLWAHALDCASRELHHPLTLFVFNARVQPSYLNPSSGVCINILNTAARRGDTYLATSVLQVLSRRTGNPIQRHHYEALLETYITNNDLRTAFVLLATMKKAGCAPTEGSTRPIFAYLRRSRQAPKRAHKLLRSLRDNGHAILIQAINVLIESYIHHQNLSAAVEVYKSMQTLSSDLTPNTATFNALLRGCALSKRKDISMFLASEIVALKVPPDALTYDRLLLVCLNSDEGLENAWRYFHEMKAAGWWPRGGTLTLLAREACMKDDLRVWDLTLDEQGKGISKARLEALWVELSSSGGASPALSGPPAQD